MNPEKTPLDIYETLRDAHEETKLVAENFHIYMCAYLLNHTLCTMYVYTCYDMVESRRQTALWLLRDKEKSSS